MLKKMNLPNKLTMLRIVLVPIFIVFMCLPANLAWAKYVALGLFVIAAITDFVDGQISRKYDLVTNFGKIMDPLADKLLISAGFIMLTGLGVIPAYVTAIVILRDFFANSIRMFGADRNVTIAASLSGKIKTSAQLIGLVLALVNVAFFNSNTMGLFLTKSLEMGALELAVNVFMTVTIGLVVVSTIWSLVDYVIKFSKYIDVEK
ncbi:MAG: CDP-diacylglycerol--glycerol-3-phosphate 3-phosphatidyltransferase [Clostridia bacterium]|nr:CDP-diacylglycerol--glycerol-3-phosphate 3-phosphatidyltransferase [Clostridia bacterium]